MAQDYLLRKRVNAEVRSLVSEGWRLLGESNYPVVWRLLHHDTSGDYIRIAGNVVTKNHKYLKEV